MWDCVWFNARCFSPEHFRFVGDALASHNGKIVWIGNYQDLPKEPLTEHTQRIDCQNRVLIPSFIDCHTHTVFAGNRANEFEARLQGQSYQSIHAQGGGIKATMNATREASLESLIQQSLPRIYSMIEQGITSLEIKSGYGLDLDTERKMLKAARALATQTGLHITTTFLGAHSLPPEFDDHKTYADYVANTMLPALAEENLVDAVDGFCEHLAFKREHIETIFKQAQSLNLPVKLHAEQLSHQGGTELACDYQALSVDHLEYARTRDIQAMHKSGTVAVLLPGAFYFLNESQKPPVQLLREHQVPMAIASDCNPGTSPTTSLLLMMNMASTLFGLTPKEALLGVTQWAAKALGLVNKGHLAIGFDADIALWDVEHPRDLVYSFGFNPLHQVYQQGKLFYEKSNYFKSH